VSFTSCDTLVRKDFKGAVEKVSSSEPVLNELRTVFKNKEFRQAIKSLGGFVSSVESIFSYNGKRVRETLSLADTIMDHLNPFLVGLSRVKRGITESITPEQQKRLDILNRRLFPSQVHSGYDNKNLAVEAILKRIIDNNELLRKTSKRSPVLYGVVLKRLKIELTALGKLLEGTQ